VRVTVIEKRLEWKSDILDLTGDQLDRGYFKLHPNGMVPTLVRRRMSRAASR
jgi:glutathione S-transferase